MARSGCGLSEQWGSVGFLVRSAWAAWKCRWSPSRALCTLRRCHPCTLIAGSWGALNGESLFTLERLCLNFGSWSRARESGKGGKLFLKTHRPKYLSSRWKTLLSEMALPQPYIISFKILTFFAIQLMNSKTSSVASIMLGSISLIYLISALFSVYYHFLMFK